MNVVCFCPYTVHYKAEYVYNYYYKMKPINFIGKSNCDIIADNQFVVKWPTSSSYTYSCSMC